MNFFSSIDYAAEDFKSCSGVVRIVSHLDSDGICSAAILSKALSRLGKRYQLSIVQQLTAELVDHIAREQSGCIIFADIGSSQAGLMQKIPGRKVIVLDHHRPVNSTGFLHVNPHLHGIDGGLEISGSGVCYLFAKALDSSNSDLSHMAVIGAIGDNQEKQGMKGLNKDILKEAIESGSIRTEKGLRFFGSKGRYLANVIRNSFDPFIPGITGDEGATEDFLEKLGLLGLRMNNLTSQDEKKLANAIIEKRKDEKNPDDVYGTKYILPNESLVPDAREFSTLLNACGRLGKASVGVSALLGSPHGKKKALELLGEYRREIVDALQWYRDNVEHGDGFLIANAKENIRPTIAGILASMVARGGEHEPGTLVMVSAYDKDNLKISLRVAGRRLPKNIDAREILSDIIGKLGEFGGHKGAAGAFIPIKHEKIFHENALKVLKRFTAGS